MFLGSIKTLYPKSSLFLFNCRNPHFQVVQSCIGTKFISKWSDLACEIAIQAVKTVTLIDAEGGHREIDTKRYAKIEKIPGGTIEDSRVLKGVMFNKVPSRMFPYKKRLL
jgi:T-complex protein 1 subunit gamma